MPVQRAEADRWLLLVVGGGRVGEDVHCALLVGHVQQTSDPVDGDRCRATAKSGTARQHRAAAAAAPSLRVHPVDLLVVQVGDEHVTGSAVDGDGARKKRALVAACRRRTPAPLNCLSITSETRHLPYQSNHISRIL